VAAPVEFEFTGDEKGAMAALTALERKYDNLEEKIRRTAATSKRASQESSSAMQDAEEMTLAYAAGILTVGAAVGALSTAYARWRGDIDKTAQAATAANQKLLQEMALTGDLMNGGQVKKAIEGLPLLTDQQGGSLYAGVRGARPSAPLADVLEQMDALQPAGLLLDDAQLKNIGSLAGKLQDFAPDKSPGDIADMAYKLSQVLGEDAGQLTSGGFERAIGLLTAKKVPIEKALGFASAAMSAGVEAGTVASIAGKVQNTAQLDELFQDPEQAEKLIGKKAAQVLPLIDQQTAATMQADLLTAQSQDILLRDVEAATRTDPLTIGNKLSAAREQDTLRALAESKNMIDSAVLDEKSRTANPLSRAGIEFGGFVEAMISPASAALRMATGTATQDSLRVEADAAAMERQTAVLMDIRAAVQPPPPKVNRPAGAVDR
jgi:hypothetical protein